MTYKTEYTVEVVGDAQAHQEFLEWLADHGGCTVTDMDDPDE